MINILNKQTENKKLLAKTDDSSGTRKDLNIIRVNSVQQKSLINQLKKLNLFYKLILILNKKIEKFPHNKINDKMINSRINGPNQNIIFNFNQKNIINDRRLKNTILGSSSVANNNKQAKATNSINLNNTKNIFSIKGKYAIGTKLNIINNVEKILTSFFKYMFTLISKPQFINKHNKLIIRIFYYQNILSKDSLNSNTKLNKLYNLFNGTALAKAHYNSPKNQNSNIILNNLLALNKWNKIALSLQKNRGVDSVNDSIISRNENEGNKESARELANITKKVWINYIKNLFYNSYVLKQSKNNINISSVLPNNSNILLNSLPIPTPALTQTGRVYASGHNRGIINNKKYKNLLIKLIIATNSESLIKRRINLSKTYYNKSLLVKLTKKINNNNNNFILNNNKSLRSVANIKNGLILPYEFKGRGILLQPIYKTKMNNLIGGAYNINKLNTNNDANEFTTLNKTILNLLLINKNNLMQNSESRSTTLKQKSIKELLSNKLNNNLMALINQFNNKIKQELNFITTQTVKLSNNGLKNLNRINNNSNIIKNVYLKLLNEKSGTNLFTTNLIINIIKLIKYNNTLNLSTNLKLTNIENLATKAFYTGAVSKNINKNIADNINTVNKNNVNNIEESLQAYFFNNNNTLSTQNKNNNILQNNVNKFKSLGNLLSNIFNKNIEFQLIKLHNPGLESGVLSQMLGNGAKFEKSSALFKKLWRKIVINKASLILFNKQNNLLNNTNNIFSSLFSANDTFEGIHKNADYLNSKIFFPVYNSINSGIIKGNTIKGNNHNKNYLIENQQTRIERGVKNIDLINKNKININVSQLHDQIENVKLFSNNPFTLGKTVGINVRIAGRLKNDRSKEKQTIQTVQTGAFSKDLSSIVTKNSFTTKNKKGSFRITVKMSHIKT